MDKLSPQHFLHKDPGHGCESVLSDSMNHQQAMHCLPYVTCEYNPESRAHYHMLATVMIKKIELQKQQIKQKLAKSNSRQWMENREVT